MLCSLQLTGFRQHLRHLEQQEGCAPSDETAHSNLTSSVAATPSCHALPCNGMGSAAAADANNSISSKIASHENCVFHNTTSWGTPQTLLLPAAEVQHTVSANANVTLSPGAPAHQSTNCYRSLNSSSSSHTLTDDTQNSPVGETSAAIGFAESHKDFVLDYLLEEEGLEFLRSHQDDSSMYSLMRQWVTG